MILQRNKTKKVCMYVEKEREMDSRDCGGSVSLKSVEYAWRLETQGRVVAVWVQRLSAGRIPSCSEEMSVYSVKDFSWLDEAHHIMALLQVHLNVKLIQKPS